MSFFRSYVPILALSLSYLSGVSGAQTAGQGQELIIDQIKKTIVYIQGEYPCHVPEIKNGSQVLGADGRPAYIDHCTQVGTGFLLGYPAPELGPGMAVSLLVTSKHLLRHPVSGSTNGETNYFDSIVAFVNSQKANGDGSFISPIPIAVKGRGFLFCSIDDNDLDADVAVCPINISDSVYDFKTLPIGSFVTEQTLQNMRINENDEVLFSGLFLPYHGANKNYPIVRHGKLALIPKERIPWVENPENGSKSTAQDLYLAEITSWGGNSGSPVFVRLSGTRESGGLLTNVQYLLLGVMHGYFNASRQAALDTSAVTDTAHQEVQLTDNSGIAAIVPAQKIADIIDQPRTKAYISLIRGMSFAKAGRTAEAEAAFKIAVEILRTSDPNHPLLKEALITYSRFLRNLGRFPEANFQSRMADSMKTTQNIPDDQLR